MSDFGRQGLYSTYFSISCRYSQVSGSLEFNRSIDRSAKIIKVFRHCEEKLCETNPPSPLFTMMKKLVETSLACPREVCIAWTSWWSLSHLNIIVNGGRGTWCEILILGWGKKLLKNVHKLKLSREFFLAVSENFYNLL